MHSLSVYSLQALTLFISLSLSSPLSAFSKRQDLDPAVCADPGASLDGRCFSQLDITNYLNNPTTGWIKTTPICEDRTRCCGDGEAWSTCFLRLASGGAANQDCTVISADHCDQSAFELDPNLHPSIAPQVRYVVATIHGIHQFYYQYTLSIETAFSIVSARIDVIDGITALVYPNNQDPTKGAPFRQNLQKLTSQMTDVVGRALQGLMTDAEIFARFADSGRYSGTKPAIDGETIIQGLVTTLKTFTVSIALKATNWYEVALEKTTKEQYDAREVSPTDPIYFSPSTLRQYKLAQTGGAEPATMLRDLPKYTDLTILFDDAFNCTAEGGQGGGGPMINFNFDGTLRLDCASQLPATIPCGAPCPVDYSDDACPFIQVEGC
ncbi:MAG: hypothetical protein Q9226_004105 [Calogaya cf. arnoldii]